MAAAGIERTHLQQPAYARELAGRDHQLHQLHVRTAESAAVVAGLIEDADQVDHGVGTGERGAQHVGIVDIDLPQFDARWQQALCARRKIAAEQGDAVAVAQQALQQVPADEAGAAEHDHAHGTHCDATVGAGQAKERRCF